MERHGAHTSIDLREIITLKAPCYVVNVTTNSQTHPFHGVVNIPPSSELLDTQAHSNSAINNYKVPMEEDY
jgi:hypothetical protein